MDSRLRDNLIKKHTNELKMLHRNRLIDLKIVSIFYNIKITKTKDKLLELYQGKYEAKK